MGSFLETYPAGRAAMVSDRNSWDTSTGRCFFPFFFSFFSQCPVLFIAVNSPNLEHQHWKGEKTVKCPTILSKTVGRKFCVVNFRETFIRANLVARKLRKNIT